MFRLIFLTVSQLCLIGATRELKRLPSLDRVPPSSLEVTPFLILAWPPMFLPDSSSPAKKLAKLNERVELKSFSVTVNGDEIGKTVDFYGANSVTHSSVNLPVVEPVEGESFIRFRLNESAYSPWGFSR